MEFVKDGTTGLVKTDKYCKWISYAGYYFLQEEPLPKFAGPVSIIISLGYSEEGSLDFEDETPNATHLQHIAMCAVEGQTFAEIRNRHIAMCALDDRCRAILEILSRFGVVCDEYADVVRLTIERIPTNLWATVTVRTVE